MAEYHTHSSHPTVIADDTGPNVLIAVVAVVLVGTLIWLVAFSGLMFNRNGDTTVPPRSETNIENNQQAPPAQPAPEQPAPAQS
jgi:hypothetical protein